MHAHACHINPLKLEVISSHKITEIRGRKDLLGHLDQNPTPMQDCSLHYTFYCFVQSSFKRLWGTL